MFFEQETEFYGGLVFIIFPFIVLGAIFYFYEVTIKKWKTTEGVILRNIVKWDKRRGNNNGVWRNYIIYEYSVDGKYYQNNDRHTKNLIFGSNLKSIVPNGRFIEGEKIKVYYNPEKPHKSVIDNKFDYYNLGILFFSALGAYMVYYNWK